MECGMWYGTMQHNPVYSSYVLTNVNEIDKTNNQDISNDFVHTMAWTILMIFYYDVIEYNTIVVDDEVKHVCFSMTTKLQTSKLVNSKHTRQT